MASVYGNALRLSIFGQSHSPAIGCSIDGLPAGIAVDLDRLQAFLDRRAPGRSATSTARREADAPEFIAGITDGHTNGAPVAAIIRNGNTRSRDYDELRRKPRPGHADWPTRTLRAAGTSPVASPRPCASRAASPCRRSRPGASASPRISRAWDLSPSATRRSTP